MKSKKTFTLIELICVIGLLGLVSTILLSNGLQMLRKIQGNKDLDKFAQIINEVEIHCLLTKEEGLIKLSQQQNFLEILIYYPSQKKEFKKIEKLKLVQLTEGVECELTYHPYRGWDKECPLDLISLKDKNTKRIAR